MESDSDKIRQTHPKKILAEAIQKEHHGAEHGKTSSLSESNQRLPTQATIQEEIEANGQKIKIYKKDKQTWYIQTGRPTENTQINIDEELDGNETT